MTCVIRLSTLRIFLSVSLCLGLLSFPWAPLLIRSEATSAVLQERMGNPIAGTPEAQLPNLEEVKTRPYRIRSSKPAIPSTIRSPKNPVEPWNRRFPLPLPASVAAQIGSHLSPNRAPAFKPGGVSNSRAHHSRSMRIASPPPLLDDAFIQNFFSVALLRSPNGNEPTYWNDQFRRGYLHGQGSLQLAASELGKTLFESAEYAGRNRSDHWYVYDLYKTYLMREPDSGGWTAWENLVPTLGRETVRRGFEDSAEFANLLATITPNGSVSSNPVSLITARVDPRNQPGNGMLTRDAVWSVPLLSLPGRSGLDLGLSLAYSSMVWTRSGPYIYFDEDNGFPSPGFRLGFPTVQRRVFDAQTNTNAYPFITAAGKRVDLRQVGTSNIYEAADSSYLQLTDNGATKLVRSPDGTQLTYSEFNNEWRCTQIKSRNGNYITVNHDSWGHITTISDTLARTITFNYDGNHNPLSITQNWNGQNHQWVSFGWGTRTMQSSFSDVKLVGTANGQVLPVLSQVSVNDGSYFQFNYTNSLQISTITRKSSDNVQRSLATFNYETPGSDAPRLIDSRLSADTGPASTVCPRKSSHSIRWLVTARVC